MMEHSQTAATTKKHIAFFILPAHPHVNPTLSVVAALVRRGYRVTYVTSDQFARAASDLGAETVLCSKLFDPSALKEALKKEETLKMPTKWYTWDDSGRGYPFFITVSARTLSEVRGHYAEDRPDLIVYDSLCFAGRVLAEQWHIPAIQTTPIFAFHDVYFPRKNGVCYTPEVFVEFDKKLDEFFEGHGISAKNSLFHKEALNIHFFPRAFQFNANTFDDRFFFAGGCIAERPSLGEWSGKPGGDKPLILISASTTSYYEPEYFRMLIEAVKGLGWCVVISTGSYLELSEIGDVPEGVEIHRYVPYPKVLPHCWLNICHGGTSTIVESMYHGVALICVSCEDEPAEYSSRVAELGVGLHLRKYEVTAETMRKAILQIAANQAMRSRVQQMQESVRQERGGADDVADRIERYLIAARSASAAP